MYRRLPFRSYSNILEMRLLEALGTPCLMAIFGLAYLETTCLFCNISFIVVKAVTRAWKPVSAQKGKGRIEELPT